MTFRSYATATSGQTLYVHNETTTIGGVSYYLHQLSSADGNGTTLTASAATTGRKLMGRWVYPLSGVISIPASTWTVTYRAEISASAKNVVAHCDVDILVRMSNGTVRSTIATDVANSSSLTQINVWETLTGTYNWAAYTVIDQTDYLEVAYYIEVTTSQTSKEVSLRVDDSALALADQTKIANIMLPSEYTAEVEFTGTSNIEDWTQLVWTIDSAWTTASVSVTLQLYNYQTGQYPTSGDGYISYTSSSTPNTDETQSQTITLNPTYFRDASGNWKIKVKGVKLTTTQFDFKADLVEYKTTSYVAQAPIASFMYSPSEPSIYETITFNASASYDPDGYIANYTWNFGDGNITTVNDPIITHVYTGGNSSSPTVHNFTVTLTVTDNEGLTNSTTDTVPVLNPAVLHVSLPAGTYFGANPDAWLNDGWRFNITAASGTFTLRINNTEASKTSNDTHLIIALNNASYNNLVSLSVNSTAIPKGAFQYGTPKPYNVWDWPSGDVYLTWFNDTYIVGSIGPKNYTDLIISVTFSNATGARMHFDAYGSTDTPDTPGKITHNPLSEDSTVLFYPVGVPPIVNFTWEPPYPQVSETVTFNATESYDPDGNIVNYTWNFGDGNTTTVNNPIITHHYATYGNYSVTLTVTDNDGLTNSTVKTVNVREHPVANFTWSPFSPQVGELVTFNGSLSTPDGGYIVNYTWDFGDGNITTVSDPIITHVYSAYGNFTVTLNVTDSEGKWDTESKNITVRKYPVANFSWSPLSPEVGETVTFNGSLSTPDGGTIVSYEWDFGDGTPQEFGKNVTHVYYNNGTYTVTLNVTDSEGKWDTESKPITVKVKKYYLTVVSPYGVTGGEGWYDNSSTAYATLDTGIVDHGNGTRRIFTHWSGDASGTNYSQSDPIHMDRNKTAIANWITQYNVTFAQTGLDSAATGTVVTVNGTPITFPGLPFPMWVNESSWITYSYSDTVSSTVSGKRFKLVSVTGPSSPFHVTGPVTVTGNYKIQYQIIVTASPSGALGGTFKVTYTQCGTTYTNIQQTTQWTEWADASTNVTVSEPQAIINVTADTRYKFNSYNPSASVHMDQAKTITLIYKTQYLLVVRTDPPGLIPQPTRNLTGEDPPGYWWYNNSINIELEANLTAYLNTVKYNFTHWDIDGTNVTGNPITVHMNMPHTATAHYQVHVAPHGPKANFTEYPVTPYANKMVIFNASASLPGWNGTHTMNITEYRWDFDGDGTIDLVTPDSIATYMYASAGSYNVTLTVYAPGATPETDTTWHVKTVLTFVGGYILPVDKLSLSAPWMGLVSCLVSATVVTVTLTKRKRRKH